MSRRGCAIIGLIFLILFVVGLAGGAIGRGMNLPETFILKVPPLEIKSFFKGEALFLKNGPFPITNTLIASWVTTIIVVLFAFIATRKLNSIPSRLQGLVEIALETLINFVESVAGHKNGRRFLPVIATIFIFVLFNAYLGLLPFCGPGIYVVDKKEAVAPVTGTLEVLVHPGDKAHKDEPIFRIVTESETVDVLAAKTGHVEYSEEIETLIEEGAQIDVSANQHIADIVTKPGLIRTASTDINMTLALALVAILFIEFWGLTGRGFRHYIGEYVNVGELFHGMKLFLKGKIVDGVMALVTGVINLIIGGLEFISHMTRMISFAFRLFGNMTAGKILILSATFLIPWVMAIPFYGLELLIGFIQALIFGGLTLVFATVAVGHGSEEH